MTAPNAYVTIATGAHLGATTYSSLMLRDDRPRLTLAEYIAIAHRLDGLFHDWLAVFVPGALWRPPLALLMAPQLYDGYVPTVAEVTAVRERLVRSLFRAIAAQPHLDPLTIPLPHLLDIDAEKTETSRAHSLAPTRDQVPPVRAD